MCNTVSPWMPRLVDFCLNFKVTPRSHTLIPINKVRLLIEYCLLSLNPPNMVPIGHVLQEWDTMKDIQHIMGPYYGHNMSIQVIDLQGAFPWQRPNGKKLHPPGTYSPGYYLSNDTKFVLKRILAHVTKIFGFGFWTMVMRGNMEANYVVSFIRTFCTNQLI